MTRFKYRCKLKTIKNRRCKLPKSKGCSICWNHLHSSKVQQKYGLLVIQIFYKKNINTQLLKSNVCKYLLDNYYIKYFINIDNLFYYNYKLLNSLEFTDSEKDIII